MFVFTLAFILTLYLLIEGGRPISGCCPRAAVAESKGCAVVALYLTYHTLENYLIAPWVYGDRLRLRMSRW